MDKSKVNYQIKLEGYLSVGYDYQTNQHIIHLDGEKLDEELADFIKALPGNYVISLTYRPSYNDDDE